MDSEVLREWTTSKVHALHGPRRAGKTLKQTHLAMQNEIAAFWMNKCFAHLLGTSMFQQPLNVWSTYPIEPFWYRPSSDGAEWPGADKPVLIGPPLELDFHKLIIFDPEITWGYLIIDELNQRADRQQWQSGGQPLLMERLTQLGKSHLSLTATVQSLQWINPRYMFQVDMATGCRDAAKTLWGRNNGLRPGDLTFLYAKDLSGGETGFMYEESGQIFESQFYGKPIQPFYKTDEVQNPWEHYESIKIKRTAYELDPHGKEELESYPEDVSILETVLSEYISAGELKTSRADFLKETAKRGCKMDKTEQIDYICDCHNARKYNAMGTVQLDFGEVTNLQVKPPRKIKSRTVKRTAKN